MKNIEEIKVGDEFWTCTYVTGTYVQPWKGQVDAIIKMSEWDKVKYGGVKLRDKNGVVTSIKNVEELFETEDEAREQYLEYLRLTVEDFQKRLSDARTLLEEFEPKKAKVDKKQEKVREKEEISESNQENG